MLVKEQVPDITQWLKADHSATYFNDLMDPKNKDLREELVKKLGPYDGPATMANPQEQAEADKIFIQDCYNVYQKTLKYNGTDPAMLYRLREMKEVQQGAYQKLLNCSASDIKREIASTKSDFFINVVKYFNTPDVKAAIKDTPLFKAIASADPRASVQTYLDKLADDLQHNPGMQAVFQECDRYSDDVLESANQLGTFDPPLTPDQSLQISVFVVKTLIEGGDKDTIINKLKSDFGWKVKSGKEAQMNSEIEFIVDSAAPSDKNFEAYANYCDTKILTAAFDQAARQHPDITAYYGVGKPLCELSEAGRVYTVGEGGHTLDKNMTWSLANIHKGYSFRLCSDMTDTNIYRQTPGQVAQTPSAFSVEISALIQCGYTLQQVGNDFVFTPPMKADKTPDMDRLSQVQLKDIQRDMSDPADRKAVMKNVETAKQQKLFLGQKAMEQKQKAVSKEHEPDIQQAKEPTPPQSNFSH